MISSERSVAESVARANKSLYSRRDAGARLAGDSFATCRAQKSNEEGSGSGGVGADGEKLVPLDFGGDSTGAVLAGFDANHPAGAANVHYARCRNGFRKLDDEIDLAANIELRFGNKIQPAIAHIASVGAEFVASRFARKNAHRQTHRVTPRLAAVNSFRHQDLRGLQIDSTLTPAFTKRN